MKSLLRASLVLLVLLIAGPAVAVPLVFSGIDAGVGPGGARPNSDAAYASWLAAVGGATVDTVTFEPGNTGDWTLAGDHATESGLRTSDATTLGFNTTAGGRTHLAMWPVFGFSSASVTFDYATPVYAWGAYLTGLESSINGVVTLSTGAMIPLSIPDPTSAGVQFFGFVDYGAALSSVTLTERTEGGTSRDIWGIDDVVTAVPEPATLVLLGGGLVVLAFRRRRRKA